MITFKNTDNTCVGVSEFYIRIPDPDDDLVCLIHDESLAHVFSNFLVGIPAKELLAFEIEHHNLVSRWPVCRSVDGSLFPLAEMDAGEEPLQLEKTKLKELTAIQERFSYLLTMLRTSVCVGYGINAGMSLVEIPEPFWNRLGVEIDFLRSDLIETGQTSETLLFRSIKLECRKGMADIDKNKSLSAFSIIDWEVMKLDDPWEFFNCRGAKAEFARRIHRQYPQVKVSTAKRILQEVLKADHSKTKMKIKPG